MNSQKRRSSSRAADSVRFDDDPEISPGRIFSYIKTLVHVKLSGTKIRCKSGVQYTKVEDLSVWNSQFASKTGKQRASGKFLEKIVHDSFQEQLRNVDSEGPRPSYFATGTF